jgi:hypothetical protein
MRFKLKPKGSDMKNNKDTTLPPLAFMGGAKAMTLTPVVGTPKRAVPVRSWAGEPERKCIPEVTNEPE